MSAIDSHPRLQLPARPSLEQLRKQAKELSASSGVPLAEAQFALARRYGFDTWAALARHVESLQPPTLAHFERLARDVVAGYRHGEAAAAERVVDQLRRIMSPQTAGARLKELGVTEASPRNPDLTDAAAQSLVARSHGFETWTELVAHMSGDARARANADATLPYEIDGAENRISPRHAMTKRDWELLIAAMEEQGITRLDAAGQMTDDVLERVSRLGHLTHLMLGGSDRLTDDGLLHVTRLESLEHLDVGGWRSQITDRGLGALRALRNLKQLDAAWSQRISDAGIANLGSCDALEKVNLMGSTTGDGALAALAGKQRLRVMRTGRLVTDAGLRHLRNFPVFRTWREAEARYELMTYDGSPNHLMLDGPITDAGLGTLAALEGLGGLSLFWHVSALTPDGLAALTRLEHLGFLGCEGNLCDDRAMRHVARIPRLRMLMAQGTVATDDGFAALSRSRTLEYLWGRDCPNLTGRGFIALAALPALRGLGVSCKNVDDAALATLPSFPSLTELMPMDVGDDGFRHVGRCESLETLWCMYCRETGDAATAHIAGLKLERYYAGSTRITDASLEILGRMQTLRRVEFWQTAGVTDAGMRSLAALPRLLEIGVSGCPGVSRRGMTAFPPGVRASYST